MTGGDVAPVSALSVDGGRVRPGGGPRVADPALAAGGALAGLLGQPAAAVGRAGAQPVAAPLGEVSSPPVPLLVERMLTRSDNDLAESLARRVAVARGRPAAFAGASAAVRTVLGEAAGPVDRGIALVDGSGLSRDDRVTPSARRALLPRGPSTTTAGGCARPVRLCPSPASTARCSAATGPAPTRPGRRRRPGQDRHALEGVRRARRAP